MWISPLTAAGRKIRAKCIESAPARYIEREPAEENDPRCI